MQPILTEITPQFPESTDRSQIKAIHAICGIEIRSDGDEVYRVLAAYAECMIVG